MTYTKLSKLLRDKVPGVSSGLAPNQAAKEHVIEVLLKFGVR